MLAGTRTVPVRPVSANLDAALRFARRGWPVFPCKPGSKEPATSHGFHDASTDTRRVEHFWSRRPGMNVAVATGGSGPDVLDVDVAHGRLGYQSLNVAIRAGLVPSPMGSIRTPSGGIHLFYCGDSQRNGSLAHDGLDFRGQGGYVVTAPSRVDGRPYVVVSAWNPVPVTIDFGRIRDQFAPQPEQAPGKPRSAQQSAGHLAAWVAGQHPGNRNQATFWAACRAAELGDSDALAAIADAAVSTGLDMRAVDKTIASAVRTVGIKELRPQAEREAAL
jgi:Bifunctional DNA primase/polymerase, N-terminal